MKKMLINLIILLFMTTSSYSAMEYFGMGIPDVSAYPMVHAPFTAMNTSGVHYKEITPKDFSIQENGKNVPVGKISVDCVYDPPFDVLFILDNSTSMNEIVNGKQKWDWLKKSVNRFIDKVDLDNGSTISLVNFSSKPKMNCPFTNDKQELRDSLEQLTVDNGPTDFNNAFLHSNFGGIKLMSERPYDKRRVIIFLTDGKHTDTRGDFKTDEIIQKLQNQNTVTYTITYLDSLKNDDLSMLSQLTGGSYKQISNPAQLDDIYDMVIDKLTTLPLCIVSWESATSCDPVELFRNVQARFLPISDYISKYQYKAPDWSIFSIETDKGTYDFGNPAPSEPEIREIVISPSQDVVINDIFIVASSHFKIIDYGNGSAKKPTKPITVYAGKSKKFKVEFTQLVAKTPRFAVLYLEAEPCPLEIPLIGGNEELIITNPVGGQIYSSCDKINIEWSGIPASQSITLQYSNNNGNTWTNINTNAKNLTYSWTTPNAERKYIVRGIVNYKQNFKWAISGGGEGNDIVTSIDAQANELFCAVSVNYNGNTKVGNVNIPQIGKNDFYIARYDASGALRWVRSAGSVNYDDIAAGLVMDPVGNIYVTGRTSDGIKFGDFSNELTNPGRLYTFIAKYSPYGEMLKVVFIEPSTATDYFESYAEKIKFEYNGVDEPRIIIRGKYKGKYYNSDLKTFMLEQTNWSNYSVEFDVRLQMKAIYQGFLPPNTGFITKKISFPTQTVYETNNFTGTINKSGTNLKSNGQSDYWISKLALDAYNAFTTEEFEIVTPQMELVYNFIGSDSIGFNRDSSAIDCGSAYVSESNDLPLYEILINHSILPVKIVNVNVTGDCISCFNIDPTDLNVEFTTDKLNDITIFFTPTKKGLCKATLELVGDCGTSVFLNVFGDGLCKATAKSKFDFGQVLIGDTLKKTITTSFFNPMIIPVSITPHLEEVDGFPDNWREFEMITPLSNKKIIVPPFGEQDFVIEFYPSQNGERQVYLDYHIEANCNCEKTLITGFGLSGTISSTSIDFGKKRIKYNFAKQDIILENIGNTTKTITEIIYSDDSLKSVFPIDAITLPLDITGNTTYPIAFDFTPDKDQFYEGSISFVTKAGDSAVSQISGNVFLPKMYADVDCAGDIAIGDTGEAFINITNPSTSSELIIHSMTIANSKEFTFQDATDDIAISIGGVHKFLISYSPQLDKNHKTDITIMADNYDGLFADEWKTTIENISCDAIKLDYIPPVYTNTLLCDTQTEYIIVSNTSEASSATVRIKESTITGTGQSAFTFGINDNLIIAGGSEESIPILFEPTEIGPYNATINLVTDLGTELFDITANGVEIKPYTNPQTITIQLNRDYTLPFIVDIPQTQKGYIENWKFEIIKNNDLVYFRKNSFKVVETRIQWDTPIETDDGIMTITGTGRIDIPANGYTQELFNLRYAGLMDSIITDEIDFNVLYDCPITKEFTVQTVNIDNICNANLRLIDYSAISNNILPPAPNPIRNSFNLTYSVAFANSDIAIVLNNALGQTVKTLVKEVKENGEHTKIIDVSNIPSGMYYIKYTNGKDIKTVKIMIEK